MLGSLRFRLPALFLVGILLAGLIAALISIRFFQSYNRARAVDELRSESVGIVQLYARQAGVEAVPYKGLVKALGGDKVYWAPASTVSSFRRRKGRTRSRTSRPASPTWPESSPSPSSSRATS